MRAVIGFMSSIVGSTPIADSEPKGRDSRMCRLWDAKYSNRQAVALLSGELGWRAVATIQGRRRQAAVVEGGPTYFDKRNLAHPV